MAALHRPLYKVSFDGCGGGLLTEGLQRCNINIQKTGRIQTNNRDGTKLARNREVAKFGYHNGQKCLQK